MSAWSTRTVSTSRRRRLVAVGVVAGLVGTLGISALTRVPDVSDYFADVETVTEADLRAEVFEGTAATDRDSAVQYLIGQGFSKDEARAYARSMFDNAEKASKSDASADGDASSDGDASATSQQGSGTGGAGLSKSALSPLPTLSSLPTLSPVIRSASSGDGNSIDSVTAFWLEEDDANTSAANSDCDTDDLLCLNPSSDTIRDLKLQLEYSLSGEYEYAPGELRITVPAQIFTTRESDTSNQPGTAKAGAQIIPYPETPKKSQDFNWERVGDNYVLTNTRKLSAATKGFIQFGLVDNPAAHKIVDMSLSGEWQATVEVVTKKGNTLSQTSNALQVQVNTHQNLGAVTKTHYVNPSVQSAASLEGKIPARLQGSGEEKYVVASWVVTVDHSGNQPFRLDLRDFLDNDPYGGFVIGATDADGTELDSMVFEGWTSQSPLRFTVQTAYPASQFLCGTQYSFENKAQVTLTPLDRIDPIQTSRVAVDSNFYFYACPVPSTYGAVPGTYNLCKYGNNGEAKNYATKTPGSNNCQNSNVGGEYVAALNRLRDGEDVEIDYTVNVWGTLLSWLYDDSEGRYLVENYIDQDPVTLTMTDTGATMLTENGVRAGRDWEFVSVNISKPVIGKAEAYGLNPDGSFIQEFDSTGGIHAVRDTDPSHIPTIALEAKVGTAWQKVADVDYSSGTCQVAYEGGTPAGASPTDCAHVKLPAGTTQFRTTVETNVASIDYYVYPKLRLKATEAMQQMAEASFTNPNGSKNYAPLRYMRNSASLSLFDQSGAKRGSVDRWGDDELRGFTTDTQVYAQKNAPNVRWQDVNYDDRYVTMHYNANVKEDWFIPDVEMWRELAALGEIDPLTSGVWYDLLPKGVYPMLDSVKAEGGASVSSLRTISDYQGTGRTLLIVGIERDPNLSTYMISGDTMRYVRDTTQISFDARYDFESILAYGKDDVHNVIAFEAGKNPFGTVEPYRGEPDDPRAGNHTQTSRAFVDDSERDAMTDLNSSHDNPVFVYAGAANSVDALAAATTSLKKHVMVNNDGVWQSGTDDPATVYEGGTYSYRLALSSKTGTQSKDLIIFDSLEDFQPTAENDEADMDNPHWQGTLAGIDVSQMVEAGAAPVIYYSETSQVLGTVGAGGATVRDEASTDLSDNTIWHNWETDPPVDLSQVRAIAVDVQKTPDGDDFILDEDQTVFAVIHMKAPPLGEAQTTQFIEQNARAFNNVYAQATSFDKNIGFGGTTSFVRSDYTKVGLQEFSLDVAKKWDDDNDRDGLRPGAVTVHLLANGVDTGKTLILDDSQGWADTFRHLPYADDNGDPIAYTVVEDAVPDYTARVSLTGTDSAQVRNTHEPERISVSGMKMWANTEGATLPEQITVALYADGKQVQTKTVKPDSEGNWSYEFTDLLKYRDAGTEIDYTVGELNLGEGWISTTDGMNLTNTWHPYGDVVLSKTVENGTGVTAGLDFSFRLSLLDAEGNPLIGGFEWESSDGRTGTVNHNGTVTLRDTQTLRIKELPMGAQVSAEEAERAGFTVRDGALKEVTVEANKDNGLGFTNVYRAEGRINLEARKVLTGQELRRGQFIFEVYDEQGRLVRTAGNAADGTVTFGALSYTQADAGNTYTYTIKEKDSGAGGVTYDTAVYTARVTVTDNGDGTLTVTPTYEDSEGVGVLDAQFNNEYHASGEAALKAWKTLKGRALAAGEFSFDLLNAQGEVLQTKQNTAEGTVDFDPIAFDETQAGQTFLYVIREQAGTDSTVVYDTDSVFGYELEVVDQRNGTLGFNLSRVKVKQEGGVWVSDGQTDTDPVFRNELKPGSLSVEKHTTDGSRDQKFRFKVKLTGEDVPENGSYDYALSAVPNDPTILPIEVKDGTYSKPFVRGDNTMVFSLDSLLEEQSFSYANQVLYGIVNAQTTVFSGFSFQREHPDMPGAYYTAEVNDGYSYFIIDDGKLNWYRRPQMYSIAGYNPSEHCGQTIATLTLIGYKANDPSIASNTFDVDVVQECATGTSAFTPTPLSRSLPSSRGAGSALSPSSRAGSAKSADAAPSDDLTVVLASVSNDVNPSSRGSDTLIPSLFTSSAGSHSGVAANNDAKSSIFASVRSTVAARLPELNIKAAIRTGTIGDGGGSWSFDDETGVLTLSGTISSSSSSSPSWPSSLLKDQVTRIEGQGVILSGNMATLFGRFYNLKTIDASSWDTSDVTSMDSMFRSCTSLENVDGLEGWDTSSVTNMDSMFYGCSSLTSLSGLEGWDTSSVTSMSRVFFSCSSLRDASALANWDTLNVTTMQQMFTNCYSLSVVDISGWKTSHIAYSTRRPSFTESYSLSSLTVGSDTRLNSLSTTSRKYQWRNEDKEVVASADDMLAAINRGDGAGTWVRVEPTYTVTRVHGEGAEGGPFSEEVEVSKAYTIPDGTGFYRFGYDFAGWNGEVRRAYQPGDVIPAGTMTANSTLTLTAQWTQRSTSYTVQDGEFEFELYGGEKATFEGIPAGTAYEVYEMTQKGWVLVESRDTSGVIKATQTSQASFTNRPVEGVSTVQVEASKLLDGVGADAGAFRFTLTDDDDDIVLPQSVSNGAGGAIQFGQIFIWDSDNMTEAQALARIPSDLQDNAFAIYPTSALPKTLTITETGTYAGIDNDPDSTIEVTISLDNDGNPVVTYDRLSPVFNNTTKPSGLEISKTVVDAPANDESEFSVQITLSEGSVPFTGTSGITAAIGGRDVLLTWESGVTTVKLHGGESVRLQNIPAGINYTVEEVDIPSGWAQTGSQGLTGTLVAGEVSRAGLTNTYGASGEVSLEVYKSLVGRELLEDEFEFELLDSSGTVIATAKNLSPDIRDMIPADDTGVDWVANPHKDHALVVFDNIEIDSAGIYTYTIREKNTGDTTVNYDERSVTATVTATDNGDGTLSFTTTYEGGKDGVNLFENTVKTRDIEVTKVVAELDGEGEVQFGDLPAGYENTLFLMRLRLTGGGMEMSEHEISYAGVDGTVSGEYRPSVWSGEEMIIGVRHMETATIEGVPYGTTYVLEEIGWVLDGERHNLGDVFSYFADIGSGPTPHWEWVVNDDPKDGHEGSGYVGTIPNIYTDTPPPPLEESIGLQAHKNVRVDGGGTYTMTDGEFSFELLDDSGEVIGTATNTADGTVNFGALSFTEADAGTTFTYTIREVVPSGGSLAWRYDTHEETVTVSVEKVGTELIANADYDSDGTDGAEFTNEYAPVGYLALRADKTVTGDGASLADGDFEFELRDSIGHPIGEAAKNADDGSIYFPTITYGAGDIGQTHTYQIVEKIPVNGKAGWTYDEHVETITVTVTDTGTGFLNAEATYDVGADYAAANDPDRDAELDTTFGALFVNAYKFDPPAAGVHGSSTAYALLLMFALAGALGGTYIATRRSHSRLNCR